MKTLLLLLLVSISLSVFSQNGGQYYENGSVKIQYVGSKKVDITNKQDCPSIIHIECGAASENITIPAMGIYTYTIISTGNVKFKAKNTTNCGTPDYGWVELNLSLTSLPVKMGKITLKYTKTKNYKQ